MDNDFQARLLIDRLCDQFEKRWLQNSQFTIEEFIDSEAEYSPNSLQELILLEIDLRHTHAQRLCQTGYHERFPNESRAIHLGFERIQSLQQTHVASFSDHDNAELIANNISNIQNKIKDFQITRCIGKGGFGVVYRAVDVKTGINYALKFPLYKSLNTVEELRQLQQEAEAARHLDHPAIVKSYGVRSVEGTHFVVQQFVDGSSIRIHPPETPKETVSMLAKIADGLAYAHQQGLVHRDLKPENILLDSKHQPMIADFGLAIHESAQRRLKGQRSGSPPYMSPEQVMGLAHQMDGRSDIWSLGVVLYELLAGRRPFFGSTPEEVFEEIKTRDEKPLCMVRPELDQELQRICQKCLNKTIRKRYNSAAELRDDLNSWLEFADQWEKHLDPPLILRGLRPFDSRDSESFLQLLPGQRDRHGIPDSIQFWKQKLELARTTESFAVGALVGPSGSGKSSFIKAGLLPRIDPNIVTTVYVESTTENTVSRIEQSLRNLNNDIPDDVSLPGLLDGLKNGIWQLETPKLLIVIDQFEQWMSAQHTTTDSLLTDALRHCDGVNLFCIVSFRDDFWLDASRYFEQIGVTWNEEANVQKIDLFDTEHSRKVLHKIGFALGRLPSQQDELTTKQNRFLDSVTTGLAVNGRVICVHLTLFSEMFKNRKWTANELNRIGGFAGVGEKYLEETFGEGTDNSLTRPINAAVKKLLELMLPDSDAELRAPMKSIVELRDNLRELNDSQFESLLNTMDSKLRLMTRTSPEGEDGDSQEDAADEYHYCQLTHDYLVPSIRNWLNSKKRETWKGRAKLRLEELAPLWHKTKEDRFLPSPIDFTSMIFGLKKSQLNDVENSFLKRSSLFYASRFTALAGILLIVFIVIWQIQAATLKKRSEVVSNLKQYISEPTERASELLTELERSKDLVEQLIRNDPFFDESNPRISAALLAFGFSNEQRTKTLVQGIYRCRDVDECRFLMKQLVKSKPLALQVIEKTRLDRLTPDEKARLAIAELWLERPSKTSELFKNRSNPTAGTITSHLIRKLLPRTKLIDFLQRESIDGDLEFGLLVAATNYDFHDWSADEQNWWSQYLRDSYLTNPDAGIHAIVKLLLLSWKIPFEQFSPREAPKPGFQWWDIEIAPGICQTFVKIKAGSYKRGQGKAKLYPRVEKYFSADTIAVVQNDFWIADSEASFTLARHWIENESPDADDIINDSSGKQWKLEEKLRKMPSVMGLFQAENESLPVFGFTYAEANSLISWLNHSNQVISKSGFTFSLPSEAESQLAHRSWANTKYFFGDDSVKQYLQRYSVFVKQTKTNDYTQLVRQPFTKIPSRNGLFDMAGNLCEYVRTTKRELKIDPNKKRCFVSGGSLFDDKSCVIGYLDATSPRLSFMPGVGFRLALLPVKKLINQGDSSPLGESNERVTNN